MADKSAQAARWVQARRLPITPAWASSIVPVHTLRYAEQRDATADAEIRAWRRRR